ncbi:integrase core domain-containing protein [Paenibacillus sinopodophylli]|uniref:integrase core domain-containing protein n=1 Tax=Paenibacillus sinopodophylli TaxID=1837342 RepID=UPI00110CDEDB|nr:integrase core domain-containing protein [Paenibacillus sinopodophylli]
MIHERIPPRTPNMNAYIESFHSILERHLFGIRDFMTFEEAYEALDEYMDFYNNRKIHGSLRQMSPVQFSKWIKTLEDTSAFHRKV